MDARGQWPRVGDGKSPSRGARKNTQAGRGCQMPAAPGGSGVRAPAEPGPAPRL